jgi:phospholipase A1
MPHLWSRIQQTARLTAEITVGLLLAGQVFAGAAVPEGIAACTVIVSDSERLACYDRASGRVSGPEVRADGASESKSTPMAAPAAPATAVVAGTAKSGATGSDSMIDSVWGFNPDSDRYTIRLYRPNYLQVASYSSRPNKGPFKELFNGESLIDYDWKQNVFGIGVTLNDILDRADER